MAETAIRPAGPDELAEAVGDAAHAGRKLEITGGGSKAGVGAPRQADILDMGGFASVIDYDPPELVLTAGAGTPLSVIQALVDKEGQELAFEPFDHGPIFGSEPGKATLGGVIAAGVSGSRRVSAGGARDHLLGFEAVSGRGERFVAGGKVVKNVTGYDLPKLAANSWGRLFALTEVTVKVLPKGRERATLILRGLDPATAQAALARALGSNADVQAAAALPARMFEEAPVAAVRLEGFGPSVAARSAMIRALWSDLGEATALPPSDAARFWESFQSLAPLSGPAPLWRVNLPPSGGPKLIAALPGARWLMDWAGGLVWLSTEAAAEQVRTAADLAGGHAMLIRADEAMRARVPALHPQAPGVARLEARVRHAFDPKGVFETGRFLDAAHAD